MKHPRHRLYSKKLQTLAPRRVNNVNTQAMTSIRQLAEKVDVQAAYAGGLPATPPPSRRSAARRARNRAQIRREQPSTIEKSQTMRLTPARQRTDLKTVIRRG